VPIWHLMDSRPSCALALGLVRYRGAWYAYLRLRWGLVSAYKCTDSQAHCKLFAHSSSPSLLYHHLHCAGRIYFTFTSLSSRRLQLFFFALEHLFRGQHFSSMILLSNMRPDVHQAAAEGNITWITPQTNDTLQAGQNYTAKWNASSTLNSPIFQLCMEQGNESTKGSCGAWVSVPVQQVNGSYCVSLWVDLLSTKGRADAPCSTLPNVSSTDPFILRMHDDANPDIVSPSFFIHPAS
jgi:hypothetical protein